MTTRRSWWSWGRGSEDGDAHNANAHALAGRGAGPGDSIGSDFADSYGSLPGESPANSGVFEPPVPAATGDMGAAVTASGTAAASLIYGQQIMTGECE